MIININGKDNEKPDQVAEENKRDAEFIYAPIDDGMAASGVLQIDMNAPTAKSDSPAPQVVTVVESSDDEDDLGLQYEENFEDDEDDVVEDAVATEETDAEEEPASDDAGDMVSREEYDVLQERYDRLMSEWDNYRRRTGEELALARESANKNMAEAIIPTLDNFKLAITHADTQSDDPAVSGMVTGFVAIYRSLLSSLKREGLEVIEPQIGDKFDMESHQAVSRVEGSELGADCVAQVIQVGYKFKGKVLRPAMIAVTV